ncbi:MAG: T9SS type A sorting domain-containing protein [Candidatus Azobacteroides sp.]|nr:T9SS type A sorting domain-containing protein [Candidatus Azobacteroides sp.]
MKTTTLILAGICGSALSVFGQLNVQHNRFRAGDVLYKQQVEYVEPGEAGADRLWNFSKLKSINDEYTLEYALPPLEGDSVYILGNTRHRKNDVKENELIVGNEHNTMYYYHLKEDSLLQMGHENPSVMLAYTSPIALLHFPLNYGQTVSSGYRSQGLYSGTVEIQTEGTVTTTADAYGKMILPSGDTLNTVMRVKTLQTIFDLSAGNSDTTRTEHVGKQLEIYRWYCKGYRYPVFETVRNINTADNSVLFATAFFFPPQDHLYLETDAENMALLDQLWDLDKQNIANPDARQTETANLKDILTCKIYPDPVSALLTLEYELKADAKVGFQLFAINGHPVKTIHAKNRVKGIYSETLDCSSLLPGNYILRITANNLFMNEVIIKK